MLFRSVSQSRYGFSGYSGISGYSGPSGFSGYSGATGSNGTSGFSGYSGISGYSGATGSNGTSGFSGYSGISGYSGATGSNGASGFSGYSGSNGASGFSGYSGVIYDTIIFSIDGQGSTFTTGSKAYRYINQNYTITGWTIIANENGNCVVDVKKTDYGSFPTSSSIAGSEKPTLSSQQINSDDTLSTWTTSLNSGDILEFVIDSVS